MPRLIAFDHRVERLTRPGILVLAVCGVLIVGVVDFLTGYQVSMSLFYLGPVALATWYVGRGSGIGIAVLSCITWYITELASGTQYFHPAILIWNALVRFGFFLITSMLLTALRNTLLGQQQLARTDVLTELYSRRAFDDRLRHDLALAQRRKSALTLAYVDLDNFKALNDTLGHTEGDRVLRAIGQVLNDSVRKVDTAARIGGDEFALVLPDTDSDSAQQVVTKLRDELQKTLAASGWSITCSIGVITLLEPVMSPEDAVEAADKLMYEVKRTRKGAVSFCVVGQATQPRLPAETL